MIDLEDFRTKLGLELLGPTTKKQLDINVTDINRPGMQFCGFYEYFAHERVQVIGKVEMTYLESLESRMRRPVLEKYMSYPIPCIITCWGMTPPRDLLEIARAHDVPVFQSKLKTTKFTLQAIMYLNRMLAPHITRHGVLVDVYGVGILLTGESGVGKSEAALELVKRGHRLVADDAVELRKITAQRISGTSPDNIRHFLELRGIGIINARRIFGMGAIKSSVDVDLIVNLELWDDNKVYDRMGMEDHYTDILGVQVPSITIPVKPGRNIAVILEVAAMNYREKKLGYNAAHELLQRLGMMDIDTNWDTF